MKNLPERYDRNIRFFGKDGQRKSQQTRVALIGVGGLGSPVAQHLALLGVGSVTLVDDEELDETRRIATVLSVPDTMTLYRAVPRWR